MDQQERQQPRVTFALPPPSPSPPAESQLKKKQVSSLTNRRYYNNASSSNPKEDPSSSKANRLPPPRLSAAQLIAHAAGSPSMGVTTPRHTHPPHPSPGLASSSTLSSASSSTWTASYPHLQRVPDSKPLPLLTTAVDAKTTWPDGRIGYRRLPSCYDSPFETGPAPTLGNKTRLTSTNSATASPASSTAPKPTHKPSLPPRTQSWTWSWNPGASTTPIYDPDYADGPPQCLAPRPPPIILSTSADNPRATARSTATKRLRTDGDTYRDYVEQDDKRSNVSGSSGTGSFVTCASELFGSEVGAMGTIGTIANVWGEQISDLRALRL
ncbi:hypothetical protein FRB90_007182 [Tulasnella sp. 427]|nr:hypothetical protein FRB90_007182 [Tulasnella sp. 427]